MKLIAEDAMVFLTREEGAAYKGDEAVRKRVNHELLDAMDGERVRRSGLANPRLVQYVHTGLVFEEGSDEEIAAISRQRERYYFTVESPAIEEE